MIIPPGFGQITHWFSILGSTRKAAVTYGVELLGTDFGENRAEDAHTAMGVRWRPHMTTPWFLDRTTLKVGPQATGPTYEFVNPIQGQDSGNSVTPAVAVLVRKRTALGGRMNRGRFYLPGIDEDAVGSTGALDSADRAAMQTSITGLLTDLTAADIPMVLLHNASSDPTDVSSLEVDAVVATQRRRQR